MEALLDSVGSCNRFQYYLLGICCILAHPIVESVLLTYFTAYNPPWQCVRNSTACNMKGSMALGMKHYYTRCAMERSEWKYTEPKSFSIVTEFDLSCKREPLIYVSNSVLFIGWALASVVAGWFADRFGRKTVLYPSLFLTILVRFISGFSPNVWMYIVCRFLIGAIASGAFIQGYVILFEVVRENRRPLLGFISSINFTLILLLLGVKAYFIREWRNLIMACSVHNLIFMALFYRYIPESFRWLLIRNRIDESVSILKKVARVNKRTVNESKFKLIYETNQLVDSIAEKPKIQWRKMVWPIGALRCIMIQFYVWFACGIVYYGVALAADDLGHDRYSGYILANLASIPGAFLMLFFTNRYGRKMSSSSTLFLAAFVLTAVSLTPKIQGNTTSRLFLGTSGKMFVTSTFASIYVWSSEISPTIYRAIAIGVMQTAGRLGSATAPWIAKSLLSLHPTAPFLTMALLSFTAAVFMQWLPETKGKPLTDVNQITDVEENDSLTVNTDGKTNNCDDDDVEQTENGGGPLLNGNDLKETALL